MMRIAMLAVGLLVAGVLAATLLIDEGEVVTLHTSGSNGDHYDTQLWVVEEGGELYLRAHFSRARWLARVREHPEVELRRGDQSQHFVAGPLDDPQVRRAVNRAMAEKYGLADRLASALWDPQSSVPVHLDRNGGSAGGP
jgi:hypothetical protein